MRRFPALLTIVTLILSSALLAQSDTRRAAQARAQDDSVRAKRVAREAQSRRDSRDRIREEVRHELRAGLEEARHAAELARETMEEVNLDAIMETARLSAEIAGEVVGNLDWEEISEHAALAADLAVEAAELHELSGHLAEFPPMPDFPPIPMIAPVPAIPPIGPIPPVPAIIHSEGWWHERSARYRQYLNEDEQVRLNALRALLEQDETLALPEAQKLLRHENWAMRAATLELLGDVEGKEAVGILREALRNETDKRVKRAAIRALSRSDEPEAREALEEVLRN